jgi:hypothetical protein
MTLTLDVHAIVQRFGGVSQIARLLREHNYPCSKQLASYWVKSGRLPMQVWMKLCEITSVDGVIILDIRNYMESAP